MVNRCLLEIEGLEICLADNKRDWAKCQKEVQILKSCSGIRMK